MASAAAASAALAREKRRILKQRNKHAGASALLEPTFLMHKERSKLRGGSIDPLAIDYGFGHRFTPHPSLAVLRIGAGVHTNLREDLRALATYGFVSPRALKDEAQVALYARDLDWFIKRLANEIEGKIKKPKVRDDLSWYDMLFPRAKYSSDFRSFQTALGPEFESLQIKGFPIAQVLDILGQAGKMYREAKGLKKEDVAHSLQQHKFVLQRKIAGYVDSIKQILRRAAVPETEVQKAAEIINGKVHQYIVSNKSYISPDWLGNLADSVIGVDGDLKNYYRRMLRDEGAAMLIAIEAMQKVHAAEAYLSDRDGTIIKRGKKAALDDKAARQALKERGAAERVAAEKARSAMNELTDLFGGLGDGALGAAVLAGAGAGAGAGSAGGAGAGFSFYSRGGVQTRTYLSFL